MNNLSDAELKKASILDFTDIGEKDLIIEMNHVKFIDTKGTIHKLETEVIDLYWVCEILDSAVVNK